MLSIRAKHDFAFFGNSDPSILYSNIEMQRVTLSMKIRVGQGSNPVTPKSTPETGHLFQPADIVLFGYAPSISPEYVAIYFLDEVGIIEYELVGNGDFSIQNFHREMLRWKASKDGDDQGCGTYNTTGLAVVLLQEDRLLLVLKLSSQQGEIFLL